MITEEFLQQVAKTKDLDSVIAIKLKIDTSYQSLLNIGDLLKRLDNLTLDGSKISSVRDLGVGLKFLVSLSVNDCGLSELDGIGMLTSLKKLSARDNDIEDVTALALHETIEVTFIVFSFRFIDTSLA
jgi:Leucine-rich repeat (LRR) protein